jgi:hypothetical protein
MPVMKNIGRKATTMARVAITMGGMTSFMAEEMAFQLGLLLHAQVAVDVLHADDGIIHQQAQREDEREQGDAVDGVARAAG